jgi:hypothetical protein
MSAVLASFRRAYGASPLHLLALLASFAITGAAVVRWFDVTASDTARILIWFLGAIVSHDIVLLPLYSALDRVARRDRAPGERAAGLAAPPRPPGWVYVRVPAILSGLLLLVFFPEIFRLGGSTVRAASGQGQNVYLSRYLLIVGVVFALSGLAYALRWTRPSSRTP